MLERLFLSALLLTVAPSAIGKTADLAVVVSSTPVDVAPGGRASLTVTIRNLAGDTIGGSVTFFNPGFFLAGRFLGGRGDGFRCGIQTVNDGGAECSFDALAGGESRTLTVDIVAPPILSSVPIDIFVNVRPESGATDSDTSNNAGRQVVRVSGGGQSIDIAVAILPQPRLVNEGGESMFLVDISNRGPDPASSVLVQVDIGSSIPAGLRLLRWNPGWRCIPNGSSGSHLCASDALAAGATSRLELTFAVPRASGEVYWSLKAMADQPHVDLHFADNVAYGDLIIGSAENHERILIPLSAAATAGAFGSMWLTELRVFADTDEDVRLFPQTFSCGVPTCMAPPALGYPVSRRFVTQVYPDIGGPPQIQGALLYTRKEHADKLHMNLTVRDYSRTRFTAGTDIPVVRESQLFVGRPIHLLNIRNEERFRHTLRIYDVDAKEGAEVSIKIIDAAVNKLLADLRRTFQVDRTKHAGPFAEFPVRPGYIELGADDLPLFPLPTSQLRIQIEPITPGLRCWAFLSTTNNETQQVTLVTPQ